MCFPRAQTRPIWATDKTADLIPQGMRTSLGLLTKLEYELWLRRELWIRAKFSWVGNCTAPCPQDTGTHEERGGGRVIRSSSAQGWKRPKPLLTHTVTTNRTWLPNTWKCSWCDPGTFLHFTFLKNILKIFIYLAVSGLSCSMWDLIFPTRDWTRVLCVARWILNHWATREVPHFMDF